MLALACVALAAGASVAVPAANSTEPKSGEAPYHFLIGTANFIAGKEGPTEMYLAVLETTGQITIKSHLDIGQNPAWMCLGNHDGSGGSSNVAYALAETYPASDGAAAFNGVTAVRVNTRTGTRYLFKENRHDWPEDGLRKVAGPTHCEVSPSGRFVVAANYGAGEVAAYPVIVFGALGKGKLLAQYGEGSHAHAIAFPPKAEGKEFVYVVDLGLNRIHQYSWEEGEMTPLSPAALVFPAGAGPRHMVFRAQGGYAFVVNEQDSTVSLLKHDTVTGQLTIILSIASTPPGFIGKSSAAEIMIAPDGNRVFVSNRGMSGSNSTIDSFVFSPDQGNGATLFPVDSIQVPGIPRGVGLTPDAEFIITAGQDTGLFQVISVGRDGTLFNADKPQALGLLGEPTAVAFVRTPDDLAL